MTDMTDSNGQKCPWCDRPLRISVKAFTNADRYGESCVARTRCCEGLVRVSPIRKYLITHYMGAQAKDDWGE